jgi:hypothetical protein
VTATLVEELVDHAADRWTGWFPGRPRTALRPVIMAGGPAHRGRAFVFLLQELTGKPVLVCKLAFTEEEVDYVSREFDSLSRLFPVLPGSLREQMPEPIEFQRSDSMAIAITTAIEGRRLPVPDITRRGAVAGRRVMQQFFRRGFRWSKELASASRSPSPRDGRALGEIVDRFCVAFDLDSVARRNIAAFRSAVENSDVRWHPSWQHGDLAVGNVLLHRGDLRIVDWEHAAEDAEPWFDVSYAPMVTASLGRKQANASSLPEAALLVLGSRSWLGPVLRREMERVWDYSLPLQWAVALTTMRAAVRRAEQGRGWVTWASFVAASIANREFRVALPWLAPVW